MDLAALLKNSERWGLSGLLLAWKAIGWMILPPAKAISAKQILLSVPVPVRSGVEN